MTVKDGDFTVRMAARRLKDVDAHLISELYDLAFCYGHELSTATNQRILSSSTDPPIHVTIRFGSEPRHVTVSLARHHVAVNPDCVVVFGPAHATSALIVDPSITLADLRAFVRSVDAEFKDFRNPMTGARQRIDADQTVQAKLGIDDLLRGKPHGVTFTAGTTPSQVASIVDRPDDVVFVKDPATPCGFRMVFKSKAVLLSKAERIVAELVAKFGIESVDEFDRLPASEKALFEAELKALLEGTDGPKKE